MKVLLQAGPEVADDLVAGLAEAIEISFGVEVTRVAGERGAAVYLDEILLGEKTSLASMSDAGELLQATRTKLRALLGELPSTESVEWRDIVVEPSNRLIGSAALGWAVALAFSAYAYFVGFPTKPRPLWPPEMWYAFAVLLPLLWAMNIGHRIVVTRDEVIEFRRGREVARAANRSIRTIGLSAIGRSLVFENGVRIPFNELWDNAGWMRARFATLIDARVGGVQQRGNWVRLDYLTFPEGCVGCGGEMSGMRRVFFGRRLFLFYVWLWSGSWVGVAVCSACVRARRRAYLLILFAALPATLALLVGALYLTHDALGQTATVMTGFVLFLAGLLVLPNVIPPWLDHRYLGLASIATSRDHSQAWIHFRDPALREAVLTLIQQAQMEGLHAAALYLRTGPAAAAGGAGGPPASQQDT